MYRAQREDHAGAAALPWSAVACLAGAMTLTGFYVGLSKQLLLAFPLFVLAGLRFAMAALAMLPWLRAPRPVPRLVGRDRFVLFLGSFLGNFLFTICMLAGVQAAGALAAGVAMAGIPAAVALLSWALLGEALSRRTLAAVACAAAGMGLLALGRGSAPAVDTAPLWAYALLLAAVLCEAAYVVVGKHLGPLLGVRQLAARINLWGLGLMAPLALWQAHALDFAPAAVRWQDWAWLVFYALAASTVSVWLWLKGLEQVPASRAGVFTVLLPLSSAAVGVLWLGEPAGPLHALALGLALAGVWLATRPGISAPPRP